MAIRFLNKGKKKGEILIYGEIGDSWWSTDSITAKKFAEELNALGAVDEIDVRIQSYGGDVFQGMAVYQRLIQHGAKITTFIDGAAMSIASVIAMAGEKIIIAESGSLMIHDAWTIAMGNARDLEATAARLEATSVAIAEVYVARTGKKTDEVRAWMAEDKEWHGKEAVAAGFADEVAENLRIAARGGPELDKVMRHLSRIALQTEDDTPPADDIQLPHAVLDLQNDPRRAALHARKLKQQIRVSGGG